MWLASVPLRRESTKRVYATFALDAVAAADAWIASQIERLNEGHLGDYGPNSNWAQTLQ